jgi:50S ribosomal protein L16 3-hydroxylase
MWQLQNLDIDRFLAEYWQRKPLLIRQALPGFESVLSPEELAGLACEEGVHSRLVQEKGGSSPWQLRYGPFEEQDFTSLPESHYSLLVSECEKWLPELQQLLECFEFIPKWRIDDLMISYAPDGGSVGPHVDEYDVFLIQAYGRRQWSIQHDLIDTAEIIPDIDLAIMTDFNADESWTLEPGDVLYLPPKIPHHGIAVGDGCMTYSVGFRAPTVGHIFDSFLLEASDRGLTDQRYYDHPFGRLDDSAEINARDIKHFKALVTDTLKQSAGLWPDIVGKMLSDATLSEDVETIPCENFDQAGNYLWQKHPDAKLFYFLDQEFIHLYHNGQVSRLVRSPENLDIIRILCHAELIPVADFSMETSKETQSLILALIENTTLIPVLEDD